MIGRADSETRWRRLPLASRAAVHPDSGRLARHVLALTGSSDRGRRLADRAAATTAAVVGARRLPTGPPPPWPRFAEDPSDAAAWSDALRTALPGTRVVGTVRPRQPGRARLSVLGRSMGNLVVLKLAGDPGELDREATALDLLARRPLPGIETPRVVDAGTIDTADGPVAFLATTALSLLRQRPAIDEPLLTFESDLAERLADLPGDPCDHRVPVHGDLTPWNLRRTDRGLALFDWESVGWARPGTDLDGYRRACDDLRRRGTGGER